MKKSGKKNIANILALTPMQQGMLFHYLKEPTSGLYFEQLTLELSTLELSTLELSTLELSGCVEKKLFEKAWNTVIQTNEMLRTQFRWEKIKNPVQVVLKQHHIKPRYYDSQEHHREQNRQTGWLEEIKTKDRKEGFDLQEVPFRVTLCKHETNRHTLIISNHHILYDGWSNGIILKEFLTAYDTLTKGKAPEPITKTQFKDFITWHQSRDKNKEKEYWKNYLSGLDTPGELSIKSKKNRPGVSIMETYGARFNDTLAKETEIFTEKYKITTAALLYAAWGLLLQRYNNNDDVIFGTTVSGRNAGIKGIEEMVGLFINTIPLRVKTSGDRQIGELVRQVDETLRQRQEFEGTSLVNIKEYAGVAGNETLFDNILVIENYPLDKQMPQKESTLSIDSYSIAEETHYDLTVAITLFEGLEITVTYDQTRFEKENIKRLTKHFENIFTELITHHRQPVSTVKMMSDEEQRQLLVEFNDTQLEYHRDKTIHELFAQQVEKAPARIALVGPSAGEETVHITYDELNRRADETALFLKEKGVREGDIVAIKVERTDAMIVGLLSILKAGCAYLPLDPDAPESRTNYMLGDSSAKLLLTDSNLDTEETKIEITHLPTLISQAPTGRLTGPLLTGAERTAYVIYTSGSTGKPKGVIIEHSSLLNFIKGMTGIIEFKRDDTILSLTTICFDIFGLETLLPLTTGTRIVLGSSTQQREPSAARQKMEQEHVSIFQATPSRLQLLLADENSRTGLTQLKALLLGGEALPSNLLEEAREIVRGKI
ncbi:MAG: AMP-binding protein, partial [bacterium]|nr:AMP-binding protein [bacterium]